MNSANNSSHVTINSNLITLNNLEIFYRYRKVTELCLSGNGLCLDLGAGECGLKQFVQAKLGYRYFGADLVYNKKLDAVADAGTLPFEGGTFNCVILSCVLEHVLDPRAVMSEVSRVLKKGGVVYGSVSFLEPFHESYFNMSFKAVARLLTENGFAEINIEPGVTGHVLILARLIGLLGSDNQDLFSAVGRFVFPLKLLLKTAYFALELRNRILGNNLHEFRKKIREHYGNIALNLAGHILFSAEKI